MKKLIQIVSGFIAIFSIVLVLYASMKLARADQPITINPDIPDIPPITSKPLVNKEKAEIILGVSLVSFVLGSVGFSLSSSKKAT